MYNLIYKEFKLMISPFYLILPVLTGALMLVPNWLYLLVPLYFCFIAVPNLLGAYKSQNDLSFSVLMPVRKKDIVKAKIFSIIILEIIHIVYAVIFAIINHQIYSIPNFFIKPDLAYFGIVFVVYALFNLVLFPMYYKTAHKYGVPVIVATVVVLLFSTGVELLALFNTDVRNLLKINTEYHIYILLVGIVIFIGFGILAYKISSKLFKKVEV